MVKLKKTDYANDLGTGLVIILIWILIVMGWWIGFIWLKGGTTVLIL
jgi:hypothetical protein